MKKVYLACPYNHPDPAVRAARVEAADRMAARLMDAGYCVFSPLSHSHPISRHCKVDPTDHDFWLRQDLPFVAWCDALVILPMPGWAASKGIRTETAEAKRLGKPIATYTEGELKWHSAF